MEANLQTILMTYRDTPNASLVGNVTLWGLFLGRIQLDLFVKRLKEKNENMVDNITGTMELRKEASRSMKRCVLDS